MFLSIKKLFYDAKNHKRVHFWERQSKDCDIPEYSEVVNSDYYKGMEPCMK